MHPVQGSKVHTTQNSRFGSAQNTQSVRIMSEQCTKCRGPKYTSSREEELGVHNASTTEVSSAQCTKIMQKTVQVKKSEQHTSCKDLKCILKKVQGSQVLIKKNIGVQSAQHPEVKP